jgi:hypothetical protein
MPVQHVITRKCSKRVLLLLFLRLHPRRRLNNPPTMPSHHMNKISLASFREVLARYPITAPEKLRELDAQRYDVIPAAVASRDESNKHLTKIEVEKLVEWKLFVSLVLMAMNRC